MSNRLETPLQSLFQAPLSIVQERIWFLSELNTDCALYNEATAVRLEGAVDVLALQNAIAAVVERHQTLRTTLLLTEESVPVQVIKDHGPIDLPIINLSGGLRQEREEELQRVLMEIATRPFDLIRDFPWRATLLRFAVDQHVLLFVAHHMFFDGWSKDILWREVATLYQAFSQRKPNPLPALPMQYADYASWQRQWLKSEASETHLTYWKDRLVDLRAFELPTDRPRPAVQTFQGAQEHFLFGHSLSEELKALSRETGVSLFNILLAGFKTLLYRYTGQEDIALGFAVSGRHRAELDGLIGCFENALVLRTDLSGNPTFSELLERVHRITSEALEHADIPFATILKELDPDRDLTRSPLFQVTFAHQSVTDHACEFAGMGISSVTVSSETTKFDLTLHTSDTPEGLNAKLKYNSDLFDALTIKRMLGHFETLLQNIATNPAQRIFNLPILTEAEKHQLLVEWNDTKNDCPNDQCIHELFETQVQRSPESVAVIFGDQELTYRQLNCRANQLAHYLRNLGVGPEVLVGVCAKRSLDMIVALLGILKAGGAYVPLDPTYPKERLGFVLYDAKVSVLLTEQQLLDILPSAPGTRRLCLDADRPQFAEHIDTNPDHRSSSKNLAYVIYTSGSTGRPKGVAIEHFSVTTFLFWAHTVFTREDLTGVLASTSICFDLSVFELFAPLTCGGKVILVENALALPGLRASSEVTLVNTVPSAVAELVRMKGIPSSVRIINLAGEPLSTTIVQQIYQTSSVKRVYDLYGPSEDTTYSTCALRTPQGPKTIGRPILNTQVYILDRYMNPVPIGVPGQLYIGGDGLARGYLNRPDLTAEKFIPDTFSSNPGARLYSTGDMARYMPDSNIEFLGRVDHQVKLRGFRIELGEIEAVLCEDPAVQEAVAVVREDTPGTRCLVAYITRKKRESIRPVELRRYLGSKLPAYMVPSVFVLLEELPLTPNGKVDRHALPIPEQRTNLEEPAVAPRTPTEEIITRIWTNLFKVDRVGIHDNFFELGGHSLLALRLVNEVNKKFDKKLPLAAVFQAPTVEQLAKLVAHGRTLATWSSLYEIQPHGSKPPFFWIHGEDSDPFLPRYLETDRPLYGVRHQSEDGKPALYTTVPNIAKHYLSEMRSVRPHGPYFLGGYCFGGVIAFEIAHQLRRLNEDVRLLVMLEPDNPIIRQSTAYSAQSISVVLSIATSFIDWISRHKTRLNSLQPKEKARYILERAARRIRGNWRWIRIMCDKTIKRAVYRTYLALGYAIPPSLRSRYILDIYEEATAHYAQEVYPGRLTVFKVGHNSDASAWGRFAAEGLELYEISGDHRAILREPYVQQWAKTLSIEIARAQIVTETQKESVQSSTWTENR